MDETSELELIAKAFEAIAKETSYAGLADALPSGLPLNAIRNRSRRGVVERRWRELLAKADASFSS